MVSALFLLIAQADVAALRRMRYGLTPEQIVRMGPERFYAYWRKRTPDGDAGPYRGVANGIVVDARRELNARLRARLPKGEQERLRKLDVQLRFIGVLIQRNEWAFTGGNAFDPDADQLSYAEAERDLLQRRYPATAPPREPALRRYEARMRERVRREERFGFGDPLANVPKLRAALGRADALARNAGERRLVTRFLVAELRRSN